MFNFTENLNEQFKQLAEMQNRSLEPVRVFAGLAADATEQLLRQNYAVAGDVIDYSVKQANLPLSSDNISDVSAAQLAETNSFSELMNTRAGEYAELSQQFGSKVREATESVSASFKQ